MQVHFGRASFSLLSHVPTYYVLGRADLDVAACARQIADYAIAPLNPDGMEVLLIFLDQPLVWAIKELQVAVQRLLREAGEKVLACLHATHHPMASLLVVNCQFIAQRSMTSLYTRPLSRKG